jgi:hypothetical protein
MIDLSVETMASNLQEPSLEQQNGGVDCNKGLEKLDSAILSTLLADYLASKFQDYKHNHLYKLVGIGMTKRVSLLSPELPGRLWSELDIVPLIFKQPFRDLSYGEEQITVEEEADSMARKCLT